MSRIDTIKFFIANDRIDNICFDDLNDILANPSKYRLTFGEMRKIITAFTEMSKDVKECLTNTQRNDDALEAQKQINGVFRTKIFKLETRVEELEQKLASIGNICSGEDDYD